MQGSNNGTGSHYGAMLSLYAEDIKAFVIDSVYNGDHPLPGFTRVRSQIELHCHAEWASPEDRVELTSMCGLTSMTSKCR